MPVRSSHRSAGLIMVIDDNDTLCDALGTYLEGVGYQVDYAHDGAHGLSLVEQSAYDGVVLDWLLPGMNGLSVCRGLREAGYAAPILMMTGRAAVDDVVEALDAGADDYLTKPFALREMGGRLEALIRRHRQQVAPQLLQIGDLIVDTGTHEVSRGGRALRVTPIGLQILVLLMRASPRVVRREELERALWGDNPPPSDTLRSHLYLLRRLIDRPFKTQLLHTMPGVGFCLRVADEEAAA